jgi:hypothetical protein
MNSEPLSESIPRIGNGNRPDACSMAARTWMAALLATERFTVQPVATSVIVRVKQNSPKLLPPSWPTRSISTNPGRFSSHSDQVRIGIWDLSNDPGLVCERPENPASTFEPRRRRSIVAGDMATSRSASASVRSSSPSRRNIGTSTVSIGARRLPAGQRATRQHNSRADTTRDEYTRPRDARGTAIRIVPAWRSSARAWSRCQPVNSTS